MKWNQVTLEIVEFDSEAMKTPEVIKRVLITSAGWVNIAAKEAATRPRIAAHKGDVRKGNSHAYFPVHWMNVDYKNKETTKAEICNNGREFQWK